MNAYDTTQKLNDRQLEKASGGARPKYVSSFFCEKCGRTIRLNGVYSLEKALRDHEQKEHAADKKR